MGKTPEMAFEAWLALVGRLAGRSANERAAALRAAGLDACGWSACMRRWMATLCDDVAAGRLERARAYLHCCRAARRGSGDSEYRAAVILGLQALYAVPAVHATEGPQSIVRALRPSTR